MAEINSYPKVFALGHRAIQNIFQGDVIVEEKVDGSQFSFRVDPENGLTCRSRKQQMYLDAPEKMFEKAVETIQLISHRLTVGWTYRGEYLQSPKHNTLLYDRVPTNYVILYDIEDVSGNPLTRKEKEAEAYRIGLEIVPLLYDGPGSGLNIEDLGKWLDNVSILGGAKVEGVVVKNYSQWTPDGKYMVGKYVSEAFKEIHGGEWRKTNPTSGDVVDKLIAMYRTPARWQKAVQHLAEQGLLDGAPQDIPSLMKEVGIDLKEEEEEAIKEFLFKQYWPKIQRGVISGLPEWYKLQLAERAFEGSSE